MSSDTIVSAPLTQPSPQREREADASQQAARRIYWLDKRVGVLLGGLSRERDVSLRSGAAVADGLRQCGYDVHTIDVGLDVATQLRAHRTDVAVIVLHGAYGEDGTLQGLLEFLRIPYTGTGVTGSAVAMDKVICKSVARDLGIRVAAEAVFEGSEKEIAAFTTDLALSYPVIVKPACEGSTIGITIVKHAHELAAALQLAMTSDAKILVEEFISGKEITVSLLDDQILPAVEICPKSGMYDYQSKYTKGMTDYIVPARIADATWKYVAHATQQLGRLLHTRGAARADYIVRSDGSAVFLEINTMPGMTETSLVPKAAAQAGISFPALCERMLLSARLERR